MINKTFQTIHNKYSSIFKFIFFLRYLFAIFFLSLTLFLLIPNFFNYEKKDKFIKDYLLETYNLELNNYKKIKFNSLPKPNLEIQEISAKISSTGVSINTKKLNIYPKLKSIYNYKNFVASKIVLNKNKTSLNVNELKTFSSYINGLNNKIIFNNLKLKINLENNSFVNLNNINFSNYGYNNNIIKGEIFNKQFKIKIKEDLKKINFKLLGTGIVIDLNFNEVKKGTPLNGLLKARILNSNLKFNFDYDNEVIKIYNSYFRSKNLSFKNNSSINYLPFFFISSTYFIEDVNRKLIKDLDINEILNAKDLIKKINSNNIIKFKSKKFSRELIENFNLNLDLMYGRLVYSNISSFSENFFRCKGESNLLEENPILSFNCIIESKDKKKLLKKFSFDYKTKEIEPFILKFSGYLNVLNNKVNFKSIQLNNEYKASKEDLNYFKDIFQKILFDQNFIEIFSVKKINQFISEIF